MTDGSRTGCRLAEVGMVSALGIGAEETWPRLLAGDTSRLSWNEALIPDERRVFGEVLERLPDVPGHLSRHDCRNNQLSLAAFEAIRPGVEAAISRFGPSRVGIVAGSSTGGMAETEKAIREWTDSARIPDCFDLVQLEYGGVSDFIRAISGAQGPCYSVSTACSTGARALASARTLLSLDLCDAVIAGAVDSLCRLTANGFFALQAISKDVPNPMSPRRDGLVLGEGGAWFLMTRELGGIQLVGVGESSDAHHMSAPDPRALGAEACMRSALEDAGLGPRSISYLNLHGTATPQNDAMESLAVERVLGLEVPCSSTKPLVGHTLGASGALEAAFCWLVLAKRRGSILLPPPHRFDGERDPALPPLHLVAKDAEVVTSGETAVMSNSFGFGGNNCTLVMKAPAS
jgi:3-oxoacyl-[acyl-carrier-protein] synthase I